MSDKLRKAAAERLRERLQVCNVSHELVEVDSSDLWLVLAALAATADAPPEVTEEMVRAGAWVLSNETYFDGRGPSHEHWLFMSRKVLRAALAAAQPDTAHEEGTHGNAR